MIDKALKDKPVLRVPKTDLIRSVVASPQWNAAIGRRLVEPYPARLLESVLSVELMQEMIASSNTVELQRQLMIVQADSQRLEAVCRLAIANSLCPAPALLLVIGSDLQASQRHGLRCSGVAAVFESFIELGLMERVAARYFASLPDPDWSLEQQIAKSI